MISKEIMNHTPRISVLMPVFNGEKYLTQAIESILTQSFVDFEFIIIDDGSNDSSLEIVQKYSAEDDRIRVVVNEKNLGLANTLNKGIGLAKGEYIARMDADDISFPERFEHQVAFLDENNYIDVLGAQVIAIDTENREKWTSSYPLTPGMVRWGLIFGCQLIHPVVMMRSRLFAKGDVKYGPEIASEDFSLWARLSDTKKFANLSQTLLFYRIHAGSISKQRKQTQQQETISIIKKQLQKYLGQEISFNLAEGLVNSRNLKTNDDAIKLSRIIIQLEKQAEKWEINNQEKLLIRHKTAAKIRSIWHARNNDLRLLPYVIYSAYHHPQDVVNRIIRNFPNV